MPARRPKTAYTIGAIGIVTIATLGGAAIYLQDTAGRRIGERVAASLPLDGVRIAEDRNLYTQAPGLLVVATPRAGSRLDQDQAWGLADLVFGRWTEVSRQENPFQFVRLAGPDAVGWSQSFVVTREGWLRRNDLARLLPGAARAASQAAHAPVDARLLNLDGGRLAVEARVQAEGVPEDALAGLPAAVGDATFRALGARIALVRVVVDRPGGEPRTFDRTRPARSGRPPVERPASPEGAPANPGEERP